jgi:putative FmdB family regulatory protein
MPVYEFYCEPCHTIFSFHSPRVDTLTVPVCPVCGCRLAREVSVFSHLVRGKGDAEPSSEGDAAARMDQVMAQMGDRMQALEDEDADPREAVKVMKELATAGGVTFNSEVQEAMARIESGEDPEKIDETFSEVFETDNPFADGEDGVHTGTSVAWRRLRGPRREPKWYDLTARSVGGEGTE